MLGKFEDEFDVGKIWVVPIRKYCEKPWEYFQGCFKAHLGFDLELTETVYKGKPKIVDDGIDAYVVDVPEGREQEIADLVNNLPEIDWAQRRNLSWLDRVAIREELERRVSNIDIDGGAQYLEDLENIIEYSREAIGEEQRLLKP